MPSPIAHLTAGYVAYRLGRGAVSQPGTEAQRNARELMLVTATFSMLPDVDSIVGLLAGDFGRFHNNVTHSLLVGAAISLGFAGIMASRRGRFRFWFLVAAGCYSAHVLMDGATWGRGVMALWPISERRFLSPLPLFYGLHWSDGLFSVRHLWTVSTELLFTLLTMVFWWVWPVSKRF